MGALARLRELLPASVKALLPTLQPVDTRGGFWTLVREPFTGAWQQNITVDQNAVSAYWAVFSCVTLIAGDIAKLHPRVMERQADGTWKETINRPVLRKPNRFQTPAEFIGIWVASKLLTGNTYALKERDREGRIRALYVLDPKRVIPLVTPDGDVYYQLSSDNLAHIMPDGDTRVIVPASEMIHDKMYPLYHPLVGVSPIYACGIAAMQGAAIQNNSFRFFNNMSRPSGVLTAPGAISQPTADTLKQRWEDNFGEGKVGKVAVLGDGLKYEAMAIDAADAQLIEQLKMTAEMVAACFHVPPYKIGVGAPPTVNNTASLNQQYYDTCLQFVIETMEQRLDDGLEINTDTSPARFETWFDLSGLIRMDPMTRHESHGKAVGGGWKAPNEVRIEENLSPVAGGDTPYLQQQNQSLAALAKRDQLAIGANGEGDVQDTALNGGQVTSLQALLIAVAEGKLAKDAAKAAITAAFPKLSAALIASMVDPIVVKIVAAPAAAPEPGAPAEDDDEVPEEVARAFIETITRGFAVA